MENQILIYNKSSIDSCLSAIINKCLFNFLDFEIVSNDSNPDYIELPTIFSSYTNLDFWFVGSKPSKTWIQSIITLNPNTKIHILYDNIIESEYSEYNNVIIIDSSSKTLTLSFFRYALRYSLSIDNELTKMFENKILLSKVSDLLINFESYCNIYVNDNIPKLIPNDVYSLVRNLTSIDFNISKSLIESLPLMYSSLTSKIKKDFFEKETINIISRSIVIDYLMTFNTVPLTTKGIKSFLVNMNNPTNHKEIDLYLTEWIKINNEINNFDFVEYYSIDENKWVNVIIKKATMKLSPIDINNTSVLNDYIGIENKLNIIEYVKQSYLIDEQFIKIGKDGSFKFKTTTSKFFGDR